MGKKCKSVGLITVDQEMSDCCKQAVKLAPIFLPQKRLPISPESNRQRKKRKGSHSKNKKGVKAKNNNHKKEKKKVAETVIDEPDEVVLSSDDSEDTIPDPFEAETESEGESPVRGNEPFVIGATREEEAVNNIWSEKKRPYSSAQVVGHQQVMHKLIQYLNNFTRNRVVQDQYDIDEDELVNLQSGPDEMTEAEFVIISGQSGIGKTAVVYAVAGDLGMKVFELNSSCKRTGRILIESLQEATKSHHLRRENATSASNPISNLFKKKAVVEEPSPPVSQISANTIILLDDVDLIFDEEEQDDGFWRSLVTFIQESKVPVILTATHFIPEVLNFRLESIRGVVLNLTKPPLEDISQHLLNVFSSELDLTLNPSDCLERMKQLVIDNDYDIRRCFNNLQFWGSSFFDCKSSPSTEATQNHKCLDSIGRLLSDASFADILTATSSKTEKICIHRIAPPDNSTCEMEKRLTLMKWTADYNDLIEHVVSLIPLSPLSTPCQDVRLDILPYLSLMCRTEAEKASHEEPELLRTRRQSRKRILHYFESIGFYMSSSHRVLCEKIFNKLGDSDFIDLDFNLLNVERQECLSPARNNDSNGNSSGSDTEIES